MASSIYSEKLDRHVGNNMKAMSLNGLDGFLNLCKSLRTFDELKFTYPGSAAKYDEIVNNFPINVHKRMFKGTMCFCIETINGDECMIAQNTCADLLKYECLIAAAIKSMNSMVSDVEAKFNEMIMKAAGDFSKAFTDAENTGDLLTIEIISNFNELFRICVDEANKFNSGIPTTAAAATPAPTSAPTLPKRKRNQPSAGGKRAKKS